MAGEVIVTFVLFFAVMAVAAVVFSAWVVIAVMRGVWRALTWPWCSQRRTMRRMGWGGGCAMPGRPMQTLGRAELRIACPRSNCGAMNPAEARFCRRCGSPIMRMPVVVRRAAMW